MADQRMPNSTWPDRRLVESCLQGDQKAWNALIEKYKNLVYSIAIKYRANPTEAQDLFQAIWLDVFLDLSKLRKKSSLKSWLISLATHRCYHWKLREKKSKFDEATETESETIEDSAALPAALLEEAERDQTVREAIGRLSPSCQKLIRLLFYEDPRLPYDRVAESMDMARGSISYLRRRCLERLERRLRKLGLE